MKCFFCTEEAIYENGFPKYGVKFGLCDDHAYRTPSSRKRSKTHHFNYRYTEGAWEWAFKQVEIKKAGMSH
jgi:hypothetical protein